MPSRFRAPTVVAMVAAVVLSCTSPSFASSDSEPAQPSVKVADWQPLVLVGSRFRPFERVVIRVSDASSPTVVKRLRATRRGTFVAIVAAATVDRCSGVSIVVTGAGGRVAKTKMPLPLCPPAVP
jgi:hypothetical protein